MGFLDISIIANPSMDSGKAPALVPWPTARQSWGMHVLVCVHVERQDLEQWGVRHAQHVRARQPADDHGNWCHDVVGVDDGIDL